MSSSWHLVRVATMKADQLKVVVGGAGLGFHYNNREMPGKKDTNCKKLVSGRLVGDLSGIVKQKE